MSSYVSAHFILTPTHAEQNFNHLWEVRVSSLGHTKMNSSPFLSLQGQLFHMVTPLHIYKGLSHVILSTQIPTEAHQEKVEMFSLSQSLCKAKDNSWMLDCLLFKQPWIEYGLATVPLLGFSYWSTFHLFLQLSASRNIGGSLPIVSSGMWSVVVFWAHCFFARPSRLVQILHGMQSFHEKLFKIVKRFNDRS